MPERILLVDDEDNQRKPLASILRSWGHEVRDCASVQEAVGAQPAFMPTVVVTDLVMPGQSGIDLIRMIRPDFRGGIIVLSGKGTIEKAVEAIKEGADDFLEKPLNFQNLRVVLERMREKNEIVAENRRLRDRLAKEGSFGRLRGRSRRMVEVYNVIEQVAPSQIPVLITGESGTGKELVARTIHELSARRKAPFIAINAAAIPRDLIESELFGHERGAFTGAIARKIGCFEMADGGTLLLDEIAEMEEATQAKLLRVLQEQSFRRIGGSELIQSDVRVLAATNREPKQAMAERKLRKDLYYRLAVMTIHLPALRERVDEASRSQRTDDITLLAHAFADESCAAAGKERVDFAPETMDLLTRYRWPGNVRELRNTIERALVLRTGNEISPEDLPAEILAEAGYVPKPSKRTLHPADAGAGTRPARRGPEWVDQRGVAHALPPDGSPGELDAPAARTASPGASGPAGESSPAGSMGDAAASDAEPIAPGSPRPWFPGGGQGARRFDQDGRGLMDGQADPSSSAPAQDGGTHAPSGGASPPSQASDPGMAFTIPLGASAADVEKELIRRTLEMTGGNKTKAARILGLSLKTIHNKAKKYGL